MDNADVIHRVLENKQSLLELHSVDGAPVYFTYMSTRPGFGLAMVMEEK